MFIVVGILIFRKMVYFVNLNDKVRVSERVE